MAPSGEAGGFAGSALARAKEIPTEFRNGDRMKRVVVDHFGGPEVVRVIDDHIPRPQAGQVRVRVLAAGVSYTDAMLRAGSYLGVPKPPFTPGYELVGVVKSSDRGVQGCGWETVSAR